MRPRTIGILFGALWSVGALAGGCFSAELDPRLGDVFACEDGVDDECPDGMRCVDARCRIEEDIPIVEVVGPDNGAAIDDVVLPLELDGNIILVPEGGEHVFGEGHLEIELDGQQIARLEAGSLARSFDIPPEGGVEPGPHRIAVHLVRNDGVPYTHDGASATRLVFAADDQRRVAIVKPWPDSEIPADATSIEVTVATLNFTPGAPESGGDGHIHIFSDENPPECAPTNSCTRDPAVYSALFGGDPEQPNVASGSVTLPIGAGGEITISTMLVTDLHNALDPVDPTIQTGTADPIFDQVVVRRAAE